MADSANTLTISGSASTTFSGQIAYNSATDADVALVKNGSGTLTLTNTNNTYGGGNFGAGTTIDGGAVQVGYGSQGGSLGSGTVIDNSSLVLTAASG